jgi:hypothetical protein
LGIGAAAASVCAAAAHADTGHDSTSSRPVASARHAPAAPVRPQGSPVKTAAAVTRTPTPTAARVANNTADNSTPALTPLEAFGREIQRTFFKRYPTAAPVEISRTPSGVVTGTLGAVDPDGDPMTYTVIAPPSLGRVEIDNNLVENAIRPTAVGKKNFLFVGHPDAGWRSAVFYSLVESCRRRGINAERYLKDVLVHLPDLQQSELDRFLPGEWIKRHPEARLQKTP